MVINKLKCIQNLGLFKYTFFIRTMRKGIDKIPFPSVKQLAAGPSKLGVASEITPGVNFRVVGMVVPHEQPDYQEMSDNSLLKEVISQTGNDGQGVANDGKGRCLVGIQDIPGSPPKPVILYGTFTHQTEVRDMTGSIIPTINIGSPDLSGKNVDQHFTPASISKGAAVDISIMKCTVLPDTSRSEKINLDPQMRARMDSLISELPVISDQDILNDENDQDILNDENDQDILNDENDQDIS